MVNCIITGLLLVLCIAPSLQQVPRCLLSREDYLLCKYQNSALDRASSNQYSIHHTRLRQSQSGYLECNVRARGQTIMPISNIGSQEMRIIYSPGFIIGEEYDNQLRTEYQVQCDEGELAFFNVTQLDLQSELDCQDSNGNYRCQDYLQIIRGSFGTSDSCGTTPSNDSVVQLEFGDYTAIFRTSETVRGVGFQMYSICFKPSERNLDGCFNVTEFMSDVCTANTSVPSPASPTPTPTTPAMAPTTTTDTATTPTVAPTTTDITPTTTDDGDGTTTSSPDTTTSDIGTTTSDIGTTTSDIGTTTSDIGTTTSDIATTATTSVPTTTPPPNTKRSAEEEEVAVKYSDLFPGLYPDHLVMSRDLAEFHHQWNRVKRQDRNGKFLTLNILFNQTVYYSDNTIRIFGPDSDTKPIKEIPNVRVLQTFDPTGAIDYHFGRFMGDRDPHFMSAGPMKVIGRHAYFQLFVIDPRGILPNEEEQEELVAMTTTLLDAVPATEDGNFTEPDQEQGDLSGVPGIINRRQAVSTDLTEMDREAVLSALRNEEACNPVLRAQSRATLTYYNSVDSEFVDSLREFSISCSLVSDNTVLQCTTDSTTLPGRTLCQVDELDSFPCEPFGGRTVDLPNTPISTVSVRAVNCLGQRGVQELRVNLAP